VNVSLVLTVLGDDRPGLVESVADLVNRHEGSWQDSRMTRLAGKFAGLVRVEVPADQADALTAALENLPTQGLQVHVTRGAEAAGEESPKTLRLELVGADRPGIVRQIAHTLAGRGINVDELTTKVGNAPMSGEPMFQVSAQLRAPADLSLAQLQDALEQLANELMVDIHLDDA
jgi:glycine cleavage system regulatory protein